MTEMQKNSRRRPSIENIEDEEIESWNVLRLLRTVYSCSRVKIFILKLKT